MVSGCDHGGVGGGGGDSQNSKLDVITGESDSQNGKLNITAGQ